MIALVPASSFRCGLLLNSVFSQTEAQQLPGGLVQLTTNCLLVLQAKPASVFRPPRAVVEPELVVSHGGLPFAVLAFAPDGAATFTEFTPLATRLAL